MNPDDGRLKRIAKTVAADITPLRVSRQFRLLWTGEVVTVTGQQITVVALFIQIYALTRSPAAVGLVGLVEFVPLMIGSTVGGPLIDRFDRRQVLLVTQSLMAITSALLLYTTVLADPPLWLIYSAAGLASLVSGVDVPARQATTPVLVDKEHLQAAISMNFVMWNVAVIAGPAIGGVVVGTLGLGWAYALDLATYAAAILLVWRMDPIPPRPDASDQSGWESLKEGFAYLKGRRVLQSTFTIDLFAMVFGLPAALFPVLAVSRFHGGPEQTGFLFSAVAVGALLASLATGWTHAVKHQGRAVVWMVILWGGAITVFGFATNLVLACFLLAVAGAADTISAVFRSTILQTSLSEELRGRITSIHFFVVSGGPRLGNLESGLVAQWTSPAFAIVSGGLVCILGAIGVAAFVPEFWRYHAGEDT